MLNWLQILPQLFKPIPLQVDVASAVQHLFDRFLSKEEGTRGWQEPPPQVSRPPVAWLMTQSKRIKDARQAKEKFLDKVERKQLLLDKYSEQKPTQSAWCIHPALRPISPPLLTAKAIRETPVFRRTSTRLPGPGSIADLLKDGQWSIRELWKEQAIKPREVDIEELLFVLLSLHGSYAYTSQRSSTTIRSQAHRRERCFSFPPRSSSQ